MKADRTPSDPQRPSPQDEPVDRKVATLPVLIAIAAVVICAIVFSMLQGDERDKALNAVVQGILIGGIYALIALGVVVVFKSSKVFNLAHGGVLMFLAYLLWWLMDPMGMHLAAALVIVIIAGTLLGLGIDRFLMRPMIGQSALVTFIMTLVLGFYVISGVTILVFEGKDEVMPAIFPSGSLTVGPVTFSYPWLFAFITATAMFLVFVSYFRYTRSGLAMRCVSEDHLISQSLGINVKRIFGLSWVVGCLSAAIGGMLLGAVNGAVNNTIGIAAIMKALPVLLLGGMESLPGAFVGAMIVGLAESIAGFYVDPHVAGFSTLLPYLLMIAILVVLPHGLFGQKVIRRI
jgi:branched-chain amino acid transport system permease protein